MIARVNLSGPDARLDRVTQGHACDAARQHLQEAAEILWIELLGRRELPQYRPELGAKLGQPLINELVD